MIKNERKIEASANHKASIAASLQRRMEVARANNDTQLIGLLEQEMKQVGLN
ncbi:hypothetical protein TUMEXPCC7403_01465 [Tumidithrix helvetica PCC 7403]|uniref:hypothetical protein n=1 Tax=Tumidithrix helvetica TaxID=3457545 RepID=UPI003CB7FC0C